MSPLGHPWPAQGSGHNTTLVHTVVASVAWAAAVWFPKQIQPPGHAEVVSTTGRGQRVACRTSQLNVRQLYTSKKQDLCSTHGRLQCFSGFTRSSCTRGTDSSHSLIGCGWAGLPSLPSEGQDLIPTSFSLSYLTQLCIWKRLKALPTK